MTESPNLVIAVYTNRLDHKFTKETPYLSTSCILISINWRFVFNWSQILISIPGLREVHILFYQKWQQSWFLYWWCKGRVY